MRLDKELGVDAEGAPSRTLAARLRRLYLEVRGLIRCGYCRPHKGENATHHSPHANPRKLRRRRRGGRRVL